MTLRTRLTAAFVLVVLVPLLVGVVLLVTALPASLAGAQDRELRASSRLAATVVASWCERAQAAAEAAGRAVAAGDPAAPRRAAADLVARGLADGVRTLDPAGATTGVAGAAPQPDAPDCRSGEAAVPAGAQPGRPVQVSATVPLETATGASAGTAVAALTVDDALAARLQEAAGGQVVLLAAGRPVARSGPVPEGLPAAALVSPTDVVVTGGSAGVLAPTEPGRPVAVLFVQERRGTGTLALVALAVLAVAVLGAAGIGLALARAIIRPLEDLGDAAARVASGDLDTAIDVRARDEVGRLGEAFNAMTDDLRGYVGALEASRDELQAGVDRLGQTLSGTHDLDRILTVVLETAMATTRARAGAVLLLGPGRTALEAAVVRGDTTPPDLRLPVGVGVAGRVAAEGEPVRGELGRDGLQPGPGEPASGPVIAVPLTSSGTAIGVLVLHGRDDQPASGGFDDRDLATIRTFAGQATVAVDNVLLHEEAQRLSITDGLTGLWNYRYFTMTVAKEIERSARFGRPLALLLLDLDHFKAVNDTHGHQRGDAILVEVAARVRAQVRDVDTVARYGGEEVVLVLPETDEEGAVHAAERIREAVGGTAFGEPGEVPLRVTVSIGVAVFPTHGTSAAQLLRHADEALYDAKRGGRDRWVMAADPGLPSAAGTAAH